MRAIRAPPPRPSSRRSPRSFLPEPSAPRSAALQPLTLPPVDTARLRAFLRTRLGSEAVAFADPPAWLASGGEAVVDAFRLSDLPESHAGWGVPLVLRRLLPLKDPVQLRWEAAVHDALHAQGFPVPRVLCAEPDAAILGAPFLVAERIAGEVMLEAVTRPAELVRRLHRLPGIIWDALQRVPAVLGETQARLHALDPAPLRARLVADGLDPADVGFGARLARLRRRIGEAELTGLAPGLAWLDAERPTEDAAVVCHGDFVFTNLCVEAGRVSGVFDWSTVTLAEPAYDVSATLARLRSRVPGMPALLGWISRKVQTAMSRRYVEAYQRSAPLDPARLRYYDAYWILYELAWSGERLRAGAVPDDAIEHRWLRRETIETGVAVFREATGIELAPLLPAEA